MKLSGLEKASAKPAGGIVSVQLVPAAEFTGAVYDRGTDSYDGIDTAEPFAAYVFREDRASYSEEAVGTEGQLLVRHTLAMEFPRGSRTRPAMEELSAASMGGFVAIVTAASGERLLAGYSPRFGTAYPLRMEKVSSTSGSRRPDFPAMQVILSATDTQYSKPLED